MKSADEPQRSTALSATEIPIASYLTAGRQLDEQTYVDLTSLRRHVAIILAKNDKDTAVVIGEWGSQVIAELLAYGCEVVAPLEPAVDYDRFELEAGDGANTRLHVGIDTRFDSLTDRVRDTSQLMLDRVAEGRLECFMSTARQHGLTWRRSRNLPFPHPLPYVSPPPTTSEGKYAEEGAVIESALAFAFSLPTPGVDCYIDWFRRAPSPNGLWVLGWATVNLYNSSRNLRTHLNAQAYPTFSDNVWAGTIVHEVMHNLGWGHPDGGYVPSVAIVNYDRCIRSADGMTLALEDMADPIDDSRLIR